MTATLPFLPNLAFATTIGGIASALSVLAFLTMRSRLRQAGLWSQNAIGIVVAVISIGVTYCLHRHIVNAVFAASVWLQSGL